MNLNELNRRSFLQNTLTIGAGFLILPGRSSLFAASPANGRIQFAQIGCGRMGTGDMEGVMKDPRARLVAVCDLDTKRAEKAKGRAEAFYAGNGESKVDVKTYQDFREVLARPDIDAVVVSTPDHWHALVTIEAALAGKHIYLQKPLTYSIAEATALRTVVRAKKVILQTGSQQRSGSSGFRTASEAARNGRLGKLQRVLIGVGLDKSSGKAPAPATPPANLDYERWLGPAPEQPYMEMRVHSQKGLGRPGWITTEDFGLGMITNWGAHHIDIAQWGLGQELGGPLSIDAKATFMKDEVWTVHQKYHVEMLYPNNVQVILDDTFDNGIRFEGTDGWAWCSRGGMTVTASDGNKDGKERPGLEVSSPEILTAGSEDIRWPVSKNHYTNWIDSILANQDPIAPVDQGACSLQTCAATWIGMKLGRKLQWNAAAANFGQDTEANALCDRAARKPEYDFHVIMKNAGLH